MIKGSLVAIVSPMHEDGALDFDALRRLIEWHIEEGTNAIVVVGTTGESPTVDPEEHVELVRVAEEPRVVEVREAEPRVGLVEVGGPCARKGDRLPLHLPARGIPHPHAAAHAVRTPHDTRAD